MAAEVHLRAVAFGTPTNVGRSIQVEARIIDGPEKMLERGVTVTLTWKQIEELHRAAGHGITLMQEQQRKTDAINKSNQELVDEYEGPTPNRDSRGDI